LDDLIYDCGISYWSNPLATGVPVP
jgi:hypothetical protein